MPSFDSSSEAVKQLHNEVRLLLRQNRSHEEIENVLGQKGLEPYYIRTIIQNIEDEKTDRRSFRNSMLMGSAYIIGGITINILSYLFASENGSFIYYIFWGIIAVGIITIVRGFILYRK